MISLIFYSLFTFSVAFGAEIPQNLKDAINTKTQELQTVNQKILEVQKNLEETGEERKTLQKETKNLDYRINQLNLGVKASEITIEKLGLEIDSIKYEVEEIKAEMDIKKIGIGGLLKEIQKKDNETILTILLKNRSIAESLAELENLSDLNTGLSLEVTKLQNLDRELSDKLGLTSRKKQGVELEGGNLKNRRIIAANQKSEKQGLLRKTQNQEKVYAEEIESLKELQAAIASEVEKIEEELRLKIDPSLLPTPAPGVLGWPVVLKNQGGFGRLTQEYGEVSYLYGGKPHNGIDIGAPIGTPILAAEKGKVLEVGNQDLYCYKGAYGKFVVIEHENNLTALYAHMSLQSVKKGDIIVRGNLIGYVGSSGYATGPHLHFTVYAGSTFVLRPSKINCGPVMPFGGTLDPLRYML